jgi:hypothetical protein
VDFGVSGAVRRPGNRDPISGRDKRSSFLQTSGLALGPTWSSGRWIAAALVPAIEQPGREAEHTPANRLKNESSRDPPPPIRLHDLRREKFLVSFYSSIHASSMCVHRFHFLCCGFCDA